MSKWLLVFLLGVTVSAAQAAPLYRFKDDRGVWVTSDRLPADIAERGYSIVNESGRVLEVVAAQVAGDSLAAQDSRQEAEQQRQAEDDYLLSSFSSVADIEALRERKVAGLRSDVKHLAESLQQLQRRQFELLDRAAQAQLTGSQVPASILRAMEEGRTAQRDMGVKLGLRQKEFDTIFAGYQRFIDRFKVLQQPPQE